jgi:hypothetical protein
MPLYQYHMLYFWDGEECEHGAPCKTLVGAWEAFLSVIKFRFPDVFEDQDDFDDEDELENALMEMLDTRRLSIYSRVWSDSNTPEISQ